MASRFVGSTLLPRDAALINRSGCLHVVVLLVGLGLSSRACAGWMTLLVQPRAALSARMTNQVAAVAQPGQETAHLGESVGDLVRRNCGSVPPGYIDLLQKQGVPGLPAGFNAGTHFSADTAVTLPACLTIPKYGPSTAADPNKSPPIGDDKVWSSIYLKDALNASVAALKISQALAQSGQANVPIADPDEIHNYGEVSAQELANLHTCQIPTNGTAVPSAYNVVETLQVLSFDLHSFAPGQKSVSATIVIPDTGLFMGQTPFANDRVERIVVKNDPNDPYAGMRPYTDQSGSYHGTYVATIALGGPDFMQLLDSLDIRLHIAPLNMSSPQGKNCVVDGAPAICPVVKQDVFLNAIRSAGRMDAIVNLSVGRTAKFTEIEEALTPESHVLFVVAAGNDHTDLASRQVYPARYGGGNDGRLNLITVAALDFDGHRAGFSNFGSDYVDIAAPGCHLPVLFRDTAKQEFQPHQASGTSFSAPLVSFTAALLRTVWPHVTPRQLKARILVSSNISPLVEPTEVADSRVLDVAKALSIYEDVVDAKVGNKTVRVRGKIDENQTLFDFCNGQLSLYRASGANRKRIRKIAALTKPTDQLLLYWESDDGVLGRRVCARGPLSVRIREDFTNQLYEFTQDDLQDVVFSEEH